jgi:hypothetical protein
MREICTSGSTRGRRAADLVRYSSSYSTGHRVRNDFFKILMTVSLHKCLQTSNDLFAGANAH